MSDEPEMIEIPTAQAHAFGELLTAARGWRGSLIPKTSTGVWGPTKALLEAIAAFDQKPCDHPRSWRVYRTLNDDEVCGYCGTSLVQGLTARARPVVDIQPGHVLEDPATSSPPESSSSAP